MPHILFAQIPDNSTAILRQISDTVFNGRSIIILAATLLAGMIISWLINVIISRASNTIGRRADKSSDRSTVKRLRRVETLLVLSTAVVRLLFVGVSLYVWWTLLHPGDSGGKPTALIGAGAVAALLLNGIFSPLLRDVAFGGGMMAEQWFGVGDLVTIIPFNELGVVERITLRSTKIRTMDGDSFWITNQNIAGAKIARQGIRTIALELFVTNDALAEKLVATTNLLLPDGPSLLVTPLSILSKRERTAGCWRIVAIGETAPGREYLLEKNAVDIMTKADEANDKILLAEPVARYADGTVERQFGRAINNARKKDINNNLLTFPDSLKYLRQNVTDRFEWDGHRRPKRRKRADNED